MKTGKMSITILLSLLTLVGAQLLAQSIASVTLVLGLPEFICNILAGILYIVMAHRLVKLICRKYLRVDMSELNIPRAKISLEWLVVAIALPVFVSVCYLLMDGALQVNNAELGTKLSLVTAGIFFTGFGAGIVEEMVFRGIIMYAVEKRFNRKAAIIAPSVLFGVVHIIGMEFELLSCILVVFAGTMVGIMFSLIACTTKSVWNSAIVHAFWNMIIIGGILNIGTEFDSYSLYSYVLQTNSFALTGGEFGIEASVIAVIGYCLVSAWAVVFCRKKTK